MIGQGVQEHDIVAARRREDRRYDLQQWLQGHCRLLEGSMDAIGAGAQTIATAKHERSVHGSRKWQELFAVRARRLV
jgi:hypothetical protein